MIKDYRQKYNMMLLTALMASDVFMPNMSRKYKCNEDMVRKETIEELKKKAKEKRLRKMNKRKFINI